MKVTVTDLRKRCEELEAQGKGAMPVVWDSTRHSWDIIMRETTRNGNTVLLVNA